jgi:peptide alpha-N-acetyltransferase
MIHLEDYQGEHQLQEMRDLMEKDLSEPYTIYTYRFFLIPNPNLSLLAREGDELVGVVIGKMRNHVSHYGERINRGYIAMLAVDKRQRGKGLGSLLVEKLIERMQDIGADEVILETEVTNKTALRLYERFGFIRDKFLPRYYMNGVDAYRLKLYLK